MGSGKTTLGHEFAKRLHCGFIDMDHELENEHNLSIPDIFTKLGEAQFRIWENELLKKIAVQNNLVVATGGGLPCFYNNMSLLNYSGTTIYLRLSPKVIFERLTLRRGSRPLILGYTESQLQEYIDSTLAKREPFYLEAKYIIDAELISAKDLLKYISPQ
jgi:shikimate kinase